MSTTTEAPSTTSGNEVPLVPLQVSALTYEDLRGLAEYASGVRDDAIVRLAVYGGGRIEVLDPDQPEPAAALVVPTYVGGGVGNHNYTEYARIGTKACGEGSVDLLDINGTGKRGDSVFWTQSAVEKFLVPYYASVAGRAAPEHIGTLLGLLGSRHMVPVAPGGGITEYEVFVLIHLPQSEYVDQRGGASGANYPADLAVGLRATDGKGPCVAMHVRDLLEPPPAPLKPAQG